MATMTITLPDDLYARVVQAASEEGQTVEEFIISALERYLRQIRKEAGKEDA